MIICAFGPMPAEAYSEQSEWAYKQKYKFKVNGKEQEPWEYHVEDTLRSSESEKIFYIDGQYITTSTEKWDDLYKGTEKFTPKYMSRKDLTDFLYRQHEDVMKKGIEDYLSENSGGGEKYSEEAKREFAEKTWTDWEYCELLTDYCHLNDKERVCREIKHVKTRTNDEYFWIPASDKEQTITLEATLKGKPIKDDKDYFYNYKVYGSTGAVKLSSFGEPVSCEYGDSDPEVKYKNGNVTVPANWTGLITFELSRFATGTSTTYDIVWEHIYVSNDVAPVNKKLNVYENRAEQIELSGRTDKIKYKSADETIAKVDRNGVVSGIKAGSTVITLYKDKKAVAKIDVSVYAPRLMTSRLMLGVKEKHKLILWGTDAKIKSASSSNKKVAKVSKKGVITAKKKGNATITVKDNDGRKYTCKVYVWKTGDEILESVYNDANYKEHPIGTIWGFGSYYKGWKGGSVNPGTGACNGYAALISDAIMGDSKAYYHKDPYGLLPGDIVYIKTGGTGRHFITIVGVDYEREAEGIITYLIFNGNVHDMFYSEGFATSSVFFLSEFEQFSSWDEGCTGIDYIISRYDDNVYKK